MKVSITVNGTKQEKDVEPRTLLVHFLRDQLQLTGTNIGCDTSSCGACTIHLDGEAVKSCTVLAAQADGGTVTTIEGLSKDGVMHPMQQAFMENHGLQCGYCTPGMVMASICLLNENPNPTEEEVRLGLEGTTTEARLNTPSLIIKLVDATRGVLAASTCAGGLITTGHNVRTKKTSAVRNTRRLACCGSADEFIRQQYGWWPLLVD